MPKVHVTVPASCVSLGPGLGCLGLALGLYTTLAFQTRVDGQFTVSVESKGEVADSVAHPSITAAQALYAQAGQDPIGFTLSIRANIPAESGLGDSAALTVGGLVGANNLLPRPLARDRIATLAAELTRQPAAVITALFGGLTLTTMAGELLYRRLTMSAQKIVLALPEIPDYSAKMRDLALPEPSINDVSVALARLGLLIEGFAKNDTALIGKTMHDGLFAPLRSSLIPGFVESVAAAKEAGAFAVSLCGRGPAILALAGEQQKAVAAAFEKSFQNAGVTCRTWLINTDTQGVALSVSG